MPAHLLVEPLGDDIITIAGCLVLDALAFPRPGFVAARDLRRPGFRAWVCRSTDTPELWGFLGSLRSRDALHVTAVTCAEAHRRHGVGTALLRTAMLQARTMRLHRLTLEVRPDNEPAVALYRKLGFSDEGLRPSYYGPGDDALSFSLSLDRATRAPARTPRRGGQGS